VLQFLLPHITGVCEAYVGAVTAVTLLCWSDCSCDIGPHECDNDNVVWLHCWKAVNRPRRCHN